MALGVAAVLGITFGGGYESGLRINTTDSAPPGLWRLAHVNLTEIKPGDVVSVCPPDQAVVLTMRRDGYIGSGDCAATHSEPFLKPVVAVAGDIVTLRQGELIKVNGTSLPNSRPLPHMPVWPAGTYKVQRGQVWLVSSFNPGSFDSRYFGPVPLINIRGQVAPIFVQGNPKALTLHPVLTLSGVGRG